MPAVAEAGAAAHGGPASAAYEDGRAWLLRGFGGELESAEVEEPAAVFGVVGSPEFAHYLDGLVGVGAAGGEVAAERAVFGFQHTDAYAERHSTAGHDV